MNALIPQLETVAPLEAATTLLLAGTVVAATLADLRFQRIPNPLTLGAAAAGLLLNLLFGGLSGGFASAGGWLLGAGLLFAFFALGAMGAGDVKLLAAVGALKGASFVFNAFLLMAMAGGVIAILVTLRRRRARYLMERVSLQLQCLICTKSIIRPGEGSPSPLRFPYGLAIAVGSIGALFWSL